MNINPKILVLMVTRNAEDHLAEQLDGVLGQQDVEVTLRICDDYSTDGTFKILESYASEHDNVELVYHTEKAGASASYMELIKAAQASECDYVALAGHADIWQPYKLAVSAGHITAQTDRPELYYSGATAITGQGVELGNIFEAYRPCASNPASLLLVRNWAPSCTMLFNTALLKLLHEGSGASFGRSHDAWIHAVALFCRGYVCGDLENAYATCRIDDVYTTGRLDAPANTFDIGLSVRYEEQGAHERTQMAQALLDNYKPYFDEDTLHLITAVAQREDSPEDRFYLAGRKDLVAPTAAFTRKLRASLRNNKI